MNRDELQLCKELAESKEWKAIRTRLLDFCSRQSGSDAFCDKYSRGILYGIKVVDDWITAFYDAVKKEHKEKGID